MREIRIGNATEMVVEPSDYPPERVREILKDETVAVLGYGTQGRAQSLNLRDGGIHVIVGQREAGPSWSSALQDGWVAGQSLFSLDEAAARGTVIAYLLSDAGQKDHWPKLKHHLTDGKALLFAHGFSIVFGNLTAVMPPENIDVILVAPKGAGTTLRRMFQAGKGMNASYAVHQNASGRAKDRALAMAMAIGSAYVFETTFQREVFADLTGERGVLLGAIYGLWLAQYEVLREHGHTPAEAFNETVEEATQSLYPLIAEKGMDWMYANCSTTAQRGALDWYRRFHDAAKPVFEELYRSVSVGAEAKRAIEAAATPNYTQSLQRELHAIAENEMWRAGKAVRSLRQ